jgi:putative membrane protein
MSLLSALIPTATWDGPGWWVVFFPLGWFVFFFLVFFVVRRVGWWGCGYGPRYGRAGWHGAADPVEILDRRFAEGSIDPEEYGERRATLEARQAGERR